MTAKGHHRTIVLIPVPAVIVLAKGSWKGAGPGHGPSPNLY